MVGKPFPLLAAFLFTQHCCGQKLPCEIPHDAEGSYSFILRGRELFYFCSNETKDLKVSTCQKGQWEPNVEKNCLEFGHHRLFLPRYNYSENRIRRSPNVGKFESLKRRERVQRKIKNGQLSTKIEHNTPTIVRVHPGNRAFLLCRIENLGTNSVLWSKHSNVLSIDTLRITDDARFHPSHDEGTRTWTLEVRGIRLMDEGNYVCQVNTRPPLKHFVSLQVIPHGVPLLPPITQTVDGLRNDDMDEFRANITAIWSEINRLSKIVSTHVQDEHHHHSHKSQEGHYHPHHHGNETLEESDYHIDEHSNHTEEGGPHHDEHHFHHDHTSDEHTGHHHHHNEARGHHHHHEKESGQHHHGDSHEVDDHHDDQVGHAHKTHSHDHSKAHDDDNSDEDESRGNYPMHAYKGNDHHTIRHHHHPHISHGHHSKHHVIGHQHYNKNHDHSDESRSDENYTKKRGGIGVQRHEFNRQPEKSETVPYGSCVVTPNTEIPESRIEGNVVVLQKKFDEGPIYYKINLKGFSVGKDVRSRTHGFHIHEKALSGEGSCNSAGAHFNPLNQTHGSPNSKKRHLGDFGNIKVDRNGNLLEYEVIDHLNSIRDIIGKSFVVHERPDDLGKGGNTESLATGSAGRRLACCTIFMGVDDSIRFNG